MWIMWKILDVPFYNSNVSTILYQRISKSIKMVGTFWIPSDNVSQTFINWNRNAYAKGQQILGLVGQIEQMPSRFNLERRVGFPINKWKDC